MDGFEYLATYPTRTEAEEIKGLLEGSGIKCVLEFNETGDVMEAAGVDTGPTKIFVASEQLQRAREITGAETD